MLQSIRARSASVFLFACCLGVEAFAQCPTGLGPVEDEVGWAPIQTVSVDIVSNTGTGTFTETQVENIETAFGNWADDCNGELGFEEYVVSSAPYLAGGVAEVIFGDPEEQCGDGSAIGCTTVQPNDDWTTEWSLTSLDQSYFASSPDLFLPVMAHEIGHTFGMDDCNSGDCSPSLTIMYGSSDADSPQSPTCCDEMLLYNMTLGTYGTASCGSGGSCSGSWCVNNPESLNCGSDACSSGCCTSGGGGGGGGGGGCPSACSSDSDCCGGETCVDDYCTDVEPIILDLTGRGYQLTSAANGVLFDFFDNGKPVQMAWTAAGWDGGFLALDRNGNGKIDNGSELFGNVTPQPGAPLLGNGFLALALYDQPANGGNNNGLIDPGDTIYSKLLVWVDKNHDGISQPDELTPLEKTGIHSISLKYSLSTWTDAYGNTFRYRSQLLSNIPNDEWVYDVFLKFETSSSAPTAATKPQ